MPASLTTFRHLQAFGDSTRNLSACTEVTDNLVTGKSRNRRCFLCVYTPDLLDWVNREALQVQSLQMSFWSGFSFMSRPHFTRASRKKCQELSFRSDLVLEHDQFQPSLDCGWSFDAYGGTTFLDHLKRETHNYCQSDDTSRHLSLTNASLVRLVNESAVDEDITRPKRPVLAQTATPQVMFNDHHNFSSSLAAVSSPCKS